ncbi:DNA (cytosine-5)-methyltransferase 1 [Caballeronia arationis]|uniref:DNA (cytosine-5-)-methyltransferase n=1 Tax=Caballeronia arationis TaxID=1777142 RepID=A0A7Z7N5G1_9BURK|nr:DNA cytosine methyltransferase [Caballeronia arationis]SOE82107.1 DNA (cytosine-5)-methyltransferase 1 [Caballeronia arationis]
MKRDLMSLPLNLGAELIVDNFAGGGGASTGLERAFGRPVDVAINHDAEAIAMHTANHPNTAHYCESVFDVDPDEITSDQPVALVWLSPDCKHFSKAKGGKPVSKKIRGLAWIALRWAAKVKPRVIMLENFEEFQTWGPLAADGKPCPKNRGRTFRSFVNALCKHGYVVEWRELRACDFGAPTIRKRLFLVARRDHLPIAWSSPTHGAPTSAGVKAGKLQPWRTAAECIDWSVPCPSIFERDRLLADATMRRIAKGIMKFVVNSADPFIVSYYSDEDRFRGGSLDAPLATTTTANRFALVSPTLVQTGYGERPGQAPRVPGLDKPLGTIVAGGAKHALVAAFLAKHYGGNETPGAALADPMSTITTQDHHALVTSNLVKLRGDNVGQPTDEPLRTISAGGTHHAEVRAFLIKYYGNDKDGVDLRGPLHTVPTHDRFGLVTVHGEDYAIVDIGMRMLTPRELARAQGFPDSYVLDPFFNGKPLSKSSQVRMIGNSVCPDVATALIDANFAHEKQMAGVAA